MALQSAAELYVHAIAIEREAADRYAEFAARMADQGNHAAAALFRMLATFEGSHLAALRSRTAGLRLPSLTSDYSWHGDEAPESPARDAIAPRMSQREALVIALA